MIIPDSPGSSRETREEVGRSCVYACPFNSQSCRVLLHLPASAAGVLSILSPHLPCAWCPSWLLVCVEDLSRLGKHERRVLLAAPGRDEQAAVIEPPLPGRAAAVANRRAVGSLVRMGLITTLGRKQERGAKRAVRLSPLGQAVVIRLRDELPKGRALSLLPHRTTLLAEVQEGDLPLLQRLLASLQASLALVPERLTLSETSMEMGREEVDYLDQIAAACLFVQDVLAAQNHVGGVQQRPQNSVCTRICHTDSGPRSRL
jgi:hypothetical protein